MPSIWKSGSGRGSHLALHAFSHLRWSWKQITYFYTREMLIKWALNVNNTRFSMVFYSCATIYTNLLRTTAIEKIMRRGTGLHSMKWKDFPCTPNAEWKIGNLIQPLTGSLHFLLNVYADGGFQSANFWSSFLHQGRTFVHSFLNWRNDGTKSTLIVTF